MINRNKNDPDTVSTGLALIIFGLLVILMAPLISDFFYYPQETATFLDKNTRMPDYVSPGWFHGLGLITVVIGFSLFLKISINSTFDYMKKRHNPKNT